MEKYYGITEFAEIVNVSVQSIYKRMRKADDPIHNYIKIKDGKKVISSAAIENIYKNNNRDSSEYEEVIEPENNQENEIIKLLKEQVKQLISENDHNKKQIEDLTQRLKESSERETNYQTLLNQQQQLTAAEKQKVLLLEEKKKKGFFGLFRKKDKEE